MSTAAFYSIPEADGRRLDADRDAIARLFCGYPSERWVFEIEASWLAGRGYAEAAEIARRAAEDVQR
jgi:hypothetical protein